MIDTSAQPATARTVYSNVRLLLPDRETLGSLVVENGRITDLAEGPSRAGVDGEGAFLMPGLVELHTDNVETVLSPRPGVKWPVASAVRYHDRTVVAAGITTVCDAIALGDTVPGSTRRELYAQIVDVIGRGARTGAFAADHRIHLRCELVCDELIPVTERYIDDPLVALVSVMDHTPGQRQFADLETFERYYAGKHGMGPDAVRDLVASRQSAQARHAATNRAAIVALAQARGLPLATHDDATVEHVDEAVRERATIAEFPTSFAAARAAHEKGLLVVMGAPNMVLGGSQSGNVSALELAAAGLIDVFSSDYVPQSLLQAPFLMAAAIDAPLHDAIRTVTTNPARALGLGHDRGALAIGMRADLVFVDVVDDDVLVRGVVRDGRRVA